MMERELLILGILRRQEMHGYQLADFIDHNLAACTDLKKPTAYFLLARMARAGWVSYASGQAGKRPPRRVYHLTPAGEEAFQRLLRESLAGYAPVTFPSDIAVGYLDELAPAEAAALLAERRQAIASRLSALEAAPQHPGGFQRLIEHQAAHLRAEIAWVDRLIAGLDSDRPASS